MHGLGALTGLPEYRNGGLLLDTGVVALRDPELADRTWTVADELVVEWRALTVALLDELAPLVRRQLGLDEASMPLACFHSCRVASGSASPALTQMRRQPLAFALGGDQAMLKMRCRHPEALDR